MSFEGVAELLRRRIGLDVESIGLAALQAAVAARLRVLRLGDAGAYFEHLQTTPAEAKQLFDEIVVPETWFFRDAEPFSHVARRAAAYLRGGGQPPFRVLSAPCSTGEEPYSVAMALVDAAVPLDRVAIDACDLSARLIETAQRGRYAGYSFRGDDLGYRDRHFARDGDGWSLAAPLRDAVRFRVGNLLEPLLWSDWPRYHAIFCRNLFIYLSKEARARLLATLDQHLAEGGVIYLGHAETLESVDRRFRPTREAGAFAYVREASGSRAAPASPPLPPKRAGSDRTFTPPPERPSTLAPATLPPGTLPPAGAAAPSAPPASALDAATQLADQGRLAEAAALCEERLRDHGPDARAYELLGVVRMALGDDGAAEGCFERALYLDARRYESMVHLALIYEQRGNAAGAANLRRRADAARTRSAGDHR